MGDLQTETSLPTTTTKTKTRPWYKELSTPGPKRKFGHYNAPLSRPNNIRLLKFYAEWRNDAPVRVAIMETSIEEAPDYFALSYTWGDGALTATIECDQHEIQVTRNLERALTGIRDSNGQDVVDKDFYLWADGLCINQADLEEKKHQLSLMPQIYRNATRVIVFLSETGNARRVKEALDHIVDIERVERTIHEGFYDERHRPTSRHQGYGKLYGEVFHPDTNAALMPEHVLVMKGFHLVRRVAGDIRSDHARKKAPAPRPHHRITIEDLVEFGIPGVDPFLLDEILRSPWFGRSWINQEIAHAYAADFYVGKYRMPWDTLRRLAMVLVDLNAQQPSAEIQFAAGFLRVAKIKEMMTANPNSNMSPLQTVTLCRPCGAKDPKDKIYSVLSIMDSHSAKFPVDYSLPWQTVYELFTRHVITTENNISILSCCDWKESRDPELPSWVADWTDQKFVRQLLPSAHRASGDLRPCVSFPTSGVLCNKAIIFDRILDSSLGLSAPVRYSSMDEYSGSRAANEQRERQAARKFFASAEQVAVSVSRGSPYARPLEAFLRSLVGGRRTIPTSHDDNETAALTWYAERGAGQFPTPPASPLQGGQQESAIRAYDRAACRNCADSRLFSTHGSLVGVGPMALQQNDVVAVLYGANVPFVLREHEAGSYLLLGFCYVDGIMNGELFERDVQTQCLDIQLR